MWSKDAGSLANGPCQTNNKNNSTFKILNQFFFGKLGAEGWTKEQHRV